METGLTAADVQRALTTITETTTTGTTTMSMSGVDGDDISGGGVGLGVSVVAESVCVAYLASVRRFKWEQDFFRLMENRFLCETVHIEGDITISRFTPK
jgi:hypothetical protein